MSLLDKIDTKPLSEKEIKLEIERVNKMIDYKVGDWVETCHFLPGIVQKVSNYYDYKDLYFEDEVEIFYPHYALKYKDYTGGSLCSIEHCGVHKISDDYAKMLFALGEEMLKDLYEKWSTTDTTANLEEFSKLVEKTYYNLTSYMDNFEEMFNLGIQEKEKLTKH